MLPYLTLSTLRVLRVSVVNSALGVCIHAGRPFYCCPLSSVYHTGQPLYYAVIRHAYTSSSGTTQS
jgi:hypothetical protein